MNSSSLHTECVIVGAGPAGVSAAKWLDSLEVPFRWFSTGGRVGGLLHRVTNPIDNYPGGSFACGGALIEAFEAQLDTSDVSGPADAHVRRLELVRRPDKREDTRRNIPRRHIQEDKHRDACWRLSFADHPPVTSETVILATGTRYRRLGVPGEAEGLGRCVSQSATADGERFGGKCVAVVGGGDAGFENAMRLAEHGCNVRMLLRNRQFKARESFVERVQADPRIEIYPCPTTVTEIQPGAGVADTCRLLLDVEGRPQTLDVACLFVRIGVDPVTPQVVPAVETREGFVAVDSHQRTSLDGLFAAGDVTECLLRSVATAVGTGASAAKAAAVYLGRL